MGYDQKAQELAAVPPAGPPIHGSRESLFLRRPSVTVTTHLQTKAGKTLQ